MTTPIEPAKTEEMSFGQIIAGLARHYLGGHRALVIGGMSVVIAGLSLSWDWVVALGLAPILLALAPCAVMCALGICMHKGEGKPASGESNLPSSGDHDS
jgi:hypothetical protein